MYYSYVFNNLMHFLFNVIVLIDEWKKQLSVHFIDYNLLDVRETIASGLIIATMWTLIFVGFKFSWTSWVSVSIKIAEF